MHYFDPEIACMVGVNAAILYQNIKYWCEEHKKLDTHFKDGRYWAYISIREFTETHPYLTEKQVRHSLQILENSNLILTGFYGRGGDRTKWYTVI